MDILKKTIDALGINATNEQLAVLYEYCSEIVSWNHRVNLTGAQTIEDFIKGPLFDALTLLPVLHPKGRLVDVGSGGGLPGVPVAILVPDLEVTLAEPRSRRINFLNHVNTSFRLNLKILQTQDRELESGLWDGAVAQAVFPPQKWLKKGKRLVHTQGYVYALSSTKTERSQLPSKTILDLQHHVQRPLDGADRYAVRIKREI